MEVLEFLKINNCGYGYGYGYGDGDGSGYVDVYGSGYGYGKGDVYGDAYSYGSGDGCSLGEGNGYGSGAASVKMKSINKMSIYSIDDVSTIITKIKNNIAKGFIVNNNLTLTPCFIAKRNNLFAHGETLRKAIQSLESKLFDDMTIKERIEMFLEKFDIDKKYQAKLFFDWHFKLTGSCEMGRLSFVKNNGIDLENDYYTVAEFIELVESDYGSEIIRELKNKIEEERQC